MYEPVFVFVPFDRPLVGRRTVFDVFCARCRARVLLTSRRIRRLENREDGIVITYRCWCGEPGVWRTGRS